MKGSSSQPEGTTDIYGEFACGEIETSIRDWIVVWKVVLQLQLGLRPSSPVLCCDIGARSQCLFVNTGMSLNAQYRWILIRALLSFILAILRRACATLSSDQSKEAGGEDVSTQESALVMSGSMMLSSSSMRVQIADVSELLFRVASRSITNWVAETMTCWA